MSKQKVANARARRTSGPRGRNRANGARSNGASNGANDVLRAARGLTEHEQAAQALRDRETGLEQIVTQTPFMLTRCTRDLRYRYVSRAYAEMLGLTSNQLAGKPLIDIMGKRGWKVIQPYVERVLAGETVTYEMEVPFANRKSRFLRATYVPDKDGRGNVIGWIASLIDATEHRRGQLAVQRLAAVVQSSHDAIATKDLNGIITDWNKSAERIFGYSRNEIIGKSVLTLIPKQRHPEEKEILNKIRRGKSVEHYETVRRRKDGRLIEVSLTVSPVKDSEGKVVGASKIVRDITKQKRAERRLAEQARLLDLSNEAILVRDKNDRIVYWNHGAEELYGYSATEALGKVTHRLLRTKHAISIQQIYKNLERTDRWSGEVVHRRKDGSKVVVVSHWALGRDESGHRAYVLETNADVTQRKRAEVALKRSNDMLEKVVQHRTRALRVANTELQSEIARRKGLEGQILEISDREQERLGQELHDGLCQQLTAIGFLTRATALRLRDHRVVQVDDLEKIAQLINGSVADARNIARDLHKEEISAAELILALQDLAERKVWRTRCRLEVKTEVSIENDKVASQIFRILREAVVNANKHAQASEILLDVRRVKNEIVFRVTDNGVGFSTKPKAEKGLGFHIMQYRADSIGARLVVDSAKGGGARVAVHLPLN